MSKSCMRINKVQKLQKTLQSLGRTIVAFSGGVDSTFLLKMSVDTLGRDNVIAAIAKSETYPKREFEEALKFVRSQKIKFITINTKELKIKGYRDNPTNRCYFCKKELFSKLQNIQKRMGFDAVIDGTNYDDRLDVRYGALARNELGIISPLELVRITKGEIRKFSKKLGLATYNKPSFACLASRFPYHAEITEQKLERVDKAEAYLKKLGFSQVRVRDYGTIARIEVYKHEFKKLLQPSYREKIWRYFSRLEYKYVTLDLEGYRTGSMNL